MKSLRLSLRVPQVAVWVKSHTTTIASAALALAATATPIATAAAQAHVTGRVTLVESGRKPLNDLGTAIVWLEPLDAVASRPDTIPRQTSIAMRTREFLPHVSVVAVGGLVAFPNEDPFSHNVFSNSELGRFDLGLYPRRKTRSATVPKSGVYAVYCNIHARMSSFIIAVPTRHVARVDKVGAFAFHDVPAGTYELHAWHERAAESVSRVTVAGTESKVAVSLDARGFVAGPHVNKFGLPYPITRADRY